MAQRESSFASRNSEFTVVEEEKIEAEIDISIDSIENIIRDGNLRIKIKIQHGDVVLGESQTITIDSNNENEDQSRIINFTVGLPYRAHDSRSIDSIVSTPVLITVFELIKIEDLPPKKNARRKSKVKMDSIPQRSPEDNEWKTLGLGNIDLLPLVLGEQTYEEKLALQTPRYSWDDEAIAWENLPRITVTVSQDESETITKGREFNIMNITVESIYNLPSCFTQHMDYKCGTVLLTNKIEDSRIVIEGGKWTDYRDVERTKIWKSLWNLESRARFSKYIVDCDYDCVTNDFGQQFDLKKIVKRNDPRIEWNVVNRVLLDKNDVQRIQEQLIKYKRWPFEITTTERGNDRLADGVTYQFYANVGQLLFPGRKKTRVLAQLFAQSSSDMEEKTGLKTGIFNNHATDEFDVQTDTFIPDGSSSEESEWKENEESVPLLTENGEPVLILIEFELLKPLYAARTLEEYTRAIDALKKTTRPKAPSYYYTPDIAHDQYIRCIEHLADVIAESYRDFVDQCECNENVEDNRDDSCKISSSRSSDKEVLACPYVYIPDELSRFKQFLCEKGQYASIRSALKSKITNLLDQKFAIDSFDWCDVGNQNLVSFCYTYLMEQMHVALNMKLDVRCAEEPEEPERFEDLWMRAEEACEFEDYDKADRLFVKIICNHRKNPDSWIVYATYLVRRSNVDEAVECCKEAIKLNSRHKIALLYYGIILAAREEYTDAEIFLTAVTQLYPKFAEGWAILHLFYLKIEYYPGIDLTLCIAEECAKDPSRDSETMDILNEEPMAWTTILCKHDRIFLLTACLLLKLNLYEFAGLALTQDLCHNDKSIAFLYFSSVNRYLQQSYCSIVECLAEAESVIGLDFSVASLLGHARYKSNTINEAISRYESVDMLYDRPENIHLVHLRLAYHFIEIEEYERARNVLLRASKHSRTCKTWLGIGVCSYFLERFDECEIALTEANRIDCEDAEVWGYLCLLSMVFQRYQEFTQCYRQTVKNHLKCDKLWQLIERSMDALDYRPPFDTMEDTKDACTC